MSENFWLALPLIVLCYFAGILSNCAQEVVSLMENDDHETQRSYAEAQPQAMQSTAPYTMQQRKVVQTIVTDSPDHRRYAGLPGCTAVPRIKQNSFVMGTPAAYRRDSSTNGTAVLVP